LNLKAHHYDILILYQSVIGFRNLLRKRNAFKAKGKVEDVALGRELIGIAGFSA